MTDNWTREDQDMENAWNRDFATLSQQGLSPMEAYTQANKLEKNRQIVAERMNENMHKMNVAIWNSWYWESFESTGCFVTASAKADARGARSQERTQRIRNQDWEMER